MANSVQTWVIIVKFKTAREIMRPVTPFPLHKREEQSVMEVKETRTISLDKPLLIIPNGEAEKVEIIPITGPTLVHGKNIKRYIK